MRKVVLYAEDDSNDAFLCQRAMKDLDDLVDFRYVPDGQTAVDWLTGEGPYVNRENFPIPDVLITDLKMPFGTGFDVLRWIRSNPHLARMRVVVFSNSTFPGDIKEAASLGIAAYLPKQASCAALIHWLRTEL